MRRMMIVALGLGLIGAAVGCNCVHGICDCDRPVRGCVSPVAASAPAAAPAPVQAEPIQTPPKSVEIQSPPKSLDK